MNDSWAAIYFWMNACDARIQQLPLAVTNSVLMSLRAENASATEALVSKLAATRFLCGEAFILNALNFCNNRNGWYVQFDPHSHTQTSPPPPPWEDVMKAQKTYLG